MHFFAAKLLCIAIMTYNYHLSPTEPTSDDPANLLRTQPGSFLHPMSQKNYHTKIFIRTGIYFTSEVWVTCMCPLRSPSLALRLLRTVQAGNSTHSGGRKGGQQQ